MDKNSMELMKKLIEEKKKKGQNRNNSLKPDKAIGGQRKAFSSKKSGGLFDK